MNAITYSRQGDYLIPDLTLPTEQEIPLGKYAQMRRSYLEQHKRVTYLNLLTSGKLNEHLYQTEQTALQMLANSEFIIMLNQASTDRIELAKLLNISDLQLSYITNVGAGQGLLKVGSSLVPFVNKFPRNTELYKLMTTKFGEV